jgi:hypothetical protein
MALGRKTQKKIEQASFRLRAKLKYLSIGPQACTQAELQELARIGFIQKNPPKAPLISTYLRHHERQLDRPALQAPRKVKDGAIDYLERITDRYITKASDQLTSEVVSHLETAITPLKDRREISAVRELVANKEAITGKYLGNALKDTVANWESRWRTIMRTELNRAANWGAMDSILQNNPEKQVHEIYVYKRGNPYGNSCEQCQKFWFAPDGVTPKVYRMSELMGSSNMGRKRAQWVPTIDPTHPHETHLLRELKLGYGFVNGELQFISEDHDEYGHQRGLGKSLEAQAG